MSRTALCVLTAAGLATASVALMVGRCRILGNEIKVPGGASAWKVTLVVRGKVAGGDPRLLTALPFDFGRQHILHEVCRSPELLGKPPDAKYPQRRHVLWTLRPGVADGPFRAFYQFHCTVSFHTPTPAMVRLTRLIYAPPSPGDNRPSEPRVESDAPGIASLARHLTAGLERPRDQLQALYRYVEQQIGNEPRIQGPGMSAAECLKNGSGDSGAKSRLLVALCRHCGLPARLVNGLTLKRGAEQSAHVWAEVWVQDQWLSACPFYHHLGRVPPSYLIFSYGDTPLVRGRNVRDLSYAFLVERPGAADDGRAGEASSLRRLLTRLSLYTLPPAEQRLVEFLLLLPLAALIVCLYRNLIGLASFGTFAPALVGLAFRELGGLPGILVFIAIVLIGWLMRRVLDCYHLLQVPRMAFLLSLVVFLLIAAIVAANFHELPATRYISLFPMIILTGMIERFWALETEDGTAASFRTLLGTMIIATSISLFLSLHAVVRHMFRYPETLGLIMAAQLLLGRYTGYRLSELFRFRDLAYREAVDSRQ